MGRPATQTIKASEARQTFSQLLNRVFRGEVHVVVEKSGIPVAAIISARDLEWLQRYEKEREQDFAVLDEFREAFKDVPDEELEREVARAVAEGRQRARAAQQAAVPAQ